MTALPVTLLPFLHSLPPLPIAWPPWARLDWKPLELRIDVQPSPATLVAELDTLHRRLGTPGDPLHDCATLPGPAPGLVLRHREADGEHYVYVQDTRNGCLAGYTVFNRLIEVGRRADPYLRSPHSKYAPAYQRRGLCTAVYEWALGEGFCLVSGARQSPGAHALWHALARRHTLGYVDVRDKTPRYLGRRVIRTVLNDLHTRMLLLGTGWSVDRLVEAAGMGWVGE